MAGRMRVDYEELAADDVSLGGVAGQVADSSARFRQLGGGLGYARGAYAHVAHRVIDGVEQIGRRVEQGFGQAIREHGAAARGISQRLQDEDEHLAVEARSTLDVPAPAGASPELPRIAADPEKPHPHNPMDLVPGDAVEKPFGPTSRFEHGRDYRWVDAQGRKVRLHAHSADPIAPPGSGSRSWPTYRIQIDERYGDADGRLYSLDAGKRSHPDFDPSFAELTHIPWPSDVRLPWSSA